MIDFDAVAEEYARLFAKHFGSLPKKVTLEGANGFSVTLAEEGFQRLWEKLALASMTKEQEEIKPEEKKAEEKKATK